MAFAMAGYQLVHHGEGRWNGVAIAARDGLAVGDVVTNFGDGPVRDSGPGGAGGEVAERGRLQPVRRGADAGRDRRRAARSSASTRRTGGSSARRSTRASSPGSSGSGAGSAEDAARRTDPLVLGGDFNVAPTDEDVWDAAAVHGGTHVSEPERAAFRALLELGPRRRLPDAPRRAGPVLVVGLPGRQVPQELRDADRPPARDRRRSRRGSSMPRSTARRARDRRCRPTMPRSLLDLDEPGVPFDPDWAGALARIAARTKPR